MGVIKSNRAKLLENEKQLSQQRAKLNKASDDYGKAWDEIKAYIKVESAKIEKLPVGEERWKKQDEYMKWINTHMDKVNGDKSYAEAAKAIGELEKEQKDLAKKTAELITEKLKKPALSEEKKKFYADVSKALKEGFQY